MGPSLRVAPASEAALKEKPLSCGARLLVDPRLQQDKGRSLFWPQHCAIIAHLLADLLLQGFDEGALKVAVDDLGMHVALAADGRGVAEARRDRLDG